MGMTFLTSIVCLGSVSELACVSLRDKEGRHVENASWYIVMAERRFKSQRVPESRKHRHHVLKEYN